MQTGSCRAAAAPDKEEERLSLISEAFLYQKKTRTRYLLIEGATAMGNEDRVLFVESPSTTLSIASCHHSSEAAAAADQSGGGGEDACTNNNASKNKRRRPQDLLQQRRTHSRESSGASVKFISESSNSSCGGNGTEVGGGGGGGHRRTDSDCTLESRVIILSPGPELSDIDDDEAAMADGEYGSFGQTNDGAKEGIGTPDSSGCAAGCAPGSDGGGSNKPLLSSSDHHQPPPPPPPPDSCSSDDELGANSSGYTRHLSRPQRRRRTNNNLAGAEDIHIDIDVTDEVEDSSQDIPDEYFKTFLAAIFLFVGTVVTTTSLALTHERVPDTDPLPDLFLDNVHYQSWGLDASEVIIMAAAPAAFTLSVFHRHRSIVLRRIFFLGGIHYFYRAITMFVTVLPKPNENYECAPKAQGELTFLALCRRVAKLLSGVGLTINGEHVYCGDYIYSGHTMTLVMTYLIVMEYSPRRWFLLHWFSFCVSATGVLTLLFARGHYSIDVVLAYWVTTRLWWIYHTMANDRGLCTGKNRQSQLHKFWWWLIFRYFEGNVGGRPLPKKFEAPLPTVVTVKVVSLYERISVRLRRSSNSGNRGHDNDDDEEQASINREEERETVRVVNEENTHDSNPA